MRRDPHYGIALLLPELLEPGEQLLGVSTHRNGSSPFDIETDRRGGCMRLTRWARVGDDRKGLLDDYAKLAAEPSLRRAELYVLGEWAEQMIYSGIPDGTALEKIDTALRLAACNEDLLDRGRDPFQTVVTLIKTRNRLVHPKPSNGLAAWTQDLEDSDEAVFGPRPAERAILAVADLVVLCVPYMPHAIRHGGLAKSVAMNKDLLQAHRETVGNGIRDLPDKDAPATPTLQHQIRGRIKPAPPQS